MTSKIQKTSHKVLSQMLTQMNRCNIVVLGDLMLDRFIHGNVERISPEAPVPVLNLEAENHVPGGAANVARNLAHLGVSVTLIGTVGNDQYANMLEGALGHEAHITYRPIVLEKRMTTTKTRFMASGQQMLRVDEENKSPASQTVQKRLLKTVERSLKSADALILSDYDKGILDHATAQAAISLAHKAGVPVFADPKKTDASVFRGINMMTPNLSEFKAMVSITSSSIQDIGSAAKSLIRSNKMNAVLITLGAEGMIYVDSTMSPHHVTSMAKSVYDVSGAGDTVIASLVAALATGANPLDATALANVAAGLVVGKLGTSTILAGEVLAEVSPRFAYTEKDLLSLVNIWRESGMKIGFTNGCFDRLHPGHIQLLEKAATCCDRLVVGLNGDASTRKLKGENRPLQTEGRRAAVLSSLPMVDGVVIFDQPTPIQIIKAINPHVLVKGGDYTADEIVGASHVKSHGGKVVIAPIREGFSTTRLYSASGSIPLS